MSPTIARGRRILNPCYLLSLLFLVAAPLQAQAQSDQELARAGLDALVRLEYSQAKELFGQLQRQNPNYPLLSFLRAGIPWVKAEAQQTKGKARLPAWVAASRAYRAAMEQAQDRVKHHDPDPRWRLALGMSQFFLARTYVDQHKFFKIYFYARAGRDTLRELIHDYPDMYDAYFVLGIYEYIAGSIPRGVDWLAVLFDISGDRHLGVQYLQLAVSRASIMAPEAGRMLLAAAALQPQYVENGCQYLALSRQTMKRYPQNPHFSGAYQMLHTNCGYPKLALEENSRARGAYLKQFPEMKKILDILRVETLASMGDLAGIKAMHPSFIKKNSAYWYLALGQAYDVLGKRQLALKNYQVIDDSGDEGKPDVMHNSDNKDWVRDKVDLYVDAPYRRPETARFDTNSPFMLRP